MITVFPPTPNQIARQQSTGVSESAILAALVNGALEPGWG
jgi:hypothetical protein